MQCDWPESENRQLWTADTHRLPLMTCELVCTARRRTILHETMAQLSRLTSHSVRLVIGDTPGLALCTASVLTIIVNTIVLQSSYQLRQAFTCRTKCSRLNHCCFPRLDSRIAFLQLPQFDLVSTWRHSLQLF